MLRSKSLRLSFFTWNDLPAKVTEIIPPYDQPELDNVRQRLKQLVPKAVDPHPLVVS